MNLFLHDQKQFHKAGAKRIHGVDSRQYRTLRDSAFKGKGGKPKSI